ncbi:MAG: helicase [Hyphococcus sp.]|nr:MAG: helicase [Marinicaulis sp.]
MLAHQSGMIGLPLRLLAREIYDRIVKLRGEREVALVTGEEKIIPPNARYWVATVEAMPLERQVEFLAIDEVQLAADPERGRIFTSRILHARGSSETLFLGADTMRPVLARLFKNIQFLTRERFSQLSYTGPKKVTRLPRRSAIVAFSTDTVYAIAELIRRQRGGAAVVLGALSPRTRNAQAELYQSGEVDFLVATDAIGMGLNMDIDHVAFAASRKFDGRSPRNLTPPEMAQIAGRAGRHIRDGTFGVTADCGPLDEDIVMAIEEHAFEPVAALQWRSEVIDLSSVPALLKSLERPAPRREFVRSRREDDEDALHRLLQRDEVRDMAQGGAALSTLWDICQTPDFRKVAMDQHARMLTDLYVMLMRDGHIADAWLEPQVTRLDRVDGDIDIISTRISHIRTWTYLSHRVQWLQNAPYWQERTRAIEDKLSDALHERLTQRFVDRRTSVLLKRLKDDEPLLAGVNDDGEVIVEGQFVGRLLGFEFIIDPRASGAEAKSLRAAGEKALRPVLAARSAALANAPADELSLESNGVIRWRTAEVAKLQKGPTPLRPEVVISGLESITPNMRGRVEDRLKDFVAAKIEALLGPLIALQTAANSEGETGLKGVTKGVAYRLVENFGATSRTQFGEELKQIDQAERGKLRKTGMRFGEYTLFVPSLLKPAPAQLLVLLWTLWSDRKPEQTPPPKAGLVSLEMNENLPHSYYYAAGYRPSGKRAIRIDMLERLAGLIRTARNEANMREGFPATPQMMSLVGCSGEDFEAIMRSLGLRKTTVKKKIEPTPDSKPASEPIFGPTLSVTETSPEAAPDTVPDIASSEAASEAQAETSSENQAKPEQSPSESSTDNAEQTPVVVIADTLDTPPAETNPSADTQVSETAQQDNGPASEQSAPVEEIEIALWRPAPRKTFQKPKPANKQTRKSDERKGKKPEGGKPGRPGAKRKGSKHQGGPKHQGPMHTPRHRKVADPNSPFAVLADLKSQLGDTKNKKKSKAREKAE